jgi:hypothetical protein
MQPRSLKLLEDIRDAAAFIRDAARIGSIRSGLNHRLDD